MTQVVLVREWLLITTILLGAFGIVAGGYAYHLEQLEDEAEEITVAELLRIVEHNQEVLTELKTKPAARPLAFDACAGTDLTEVIRANGVEIPKLDFERRCTEVRNNLAAP